MMMRNMYKCRNCKHFTPNMEKSKQGGLAYKNTCLQPNGHRNACPSSPICHNFELDGDRAELKPHAVQESTTGVYCMFCGMEMKYYQRAIHGSTEIAYYQCEYCKARTPQINRMSKGCDYELLKREAYDAANMRSEPKFKVDIPEPSRTIFVERKCGSWIEDGVIKYLRDDPAVEDEQEKALGYRGRTYLKLRCSECHKITLVDETIEYKYCPHCGASMMSSESI